MKNYKVFMLLLSFMITTPTWAAEAVVLNEKNKSFLDWTVENLVLVLGGTVAISALIVLFQTVKSIWRTQTIQRFEHEGMSHAAAVFKSKHESFLGYIYQQLDGGVTLEQESDILLNHDYDGIRELDNNLPPWWIGMFYVTIAYAFIYIGVYHFSSFGLSQAEEYEKELVNAEIAIAAFNAAQKAKKKEILSADNVAALSAVDRLAAGEKTFQKYCAVCHGKKGEGVENMGQNLTDDYWIHGGGIKDIFKTITNGVPGKQMIPWKSTLKPEEIQEVSSFILTLRGTNPPNARPAEGELYEEGIKSETSNGKENEVEIN